MEVMSTSEVTAPIHQTMMMGRNLKNSSENGILVTAITVPIEPTVAGAVSQTRQRQRRTRRTDLDEGEEQDNADDPPIVGEDLDAPGEEDLHQASHNTLFDVVSSHTTCYHMS